MDERKQIAKRLEKWGQERFGTDRGWKTRFAEALEVDTGALQNYLNGLRTPGPKTQNKLRELGCNIEWLMTGKVLEGTQKSGEVSIWKAQIAHMTEEEKEEFDKFVTDLLREMREDREGAIEVARAYIAGKKTLRKEKKKK